MNTARQEHLEKIRMYKNQLKTSGPKHRRDIMKHIHRLEKELKIYDALQRQARFSC